MSDADVKNAEGASGVDGDETEPNYKPPEQKSLSTILDQDKEDEALEKYKKQLLGKNLYLNLENREHHWLGLATKIHSIMHVTVFEIFRRGCFW